MLVRNPSGNVIGVKDERVPELLKMGFTIADEDPLFVEGTGLPIQFITSIDKPDGYGASQKILRKYITKEGYELSNRYKNQDIGLVYFVPDAIKKLSTKIKLIYTMFESTSLPIRWAEFLKTADEVYVPSKFVQDCFATRDIKSKVIPLGYNHEKYTYLERDRKDKPFTFLHYNAFNIRKGFDIVFKAFTEEFKDEPNVRLVLKTVYPKTPFPILKSQYPNIDVIKADYTEEEMRELMRDADAFVFPSRGEGFGLTPLEALATGLITIIPNGSGMSEYFNPKYFEEIKIDKLTTSVYTNHNLNEVGQMIEPSVESLRERMRYVYEHQEESREKAKKGSKWVKKYSIEETGKKLAKELEKWTQ